MYESLSGSPYQGILTQYFDSTGRVGSTVSVASYTDAVEPPFWVTDTSILTEIGNVKTKLGWASTSDTQFIVIPQPDTAYNPNFLTHDCAYHGIYNSGAYAFVPYAGSEPFYKRCGGYGATKGDATSVLASHEYAEAATDPHVNTWLTSDGYELADMCSTFGDVLANGSWVTGLWDDHQSACSLSDPTPPQVYAVTSPATEVVGSHAELNGVVNTERLNANYYFEYGTTPSYGANTPSGNASSLVPFEVSSGLYGLQPETTYHFRMVATNSTGTTYGEDRTFTTLKEAWSLQSIPQPTGGHSTELSAVSCSEPHWCMAVGRYIENSSNKWVTLTEIWNGSKWEQKPNPDPSGSLEDGFLGVSCLKVIEPGTGECVAVGAYRNSSTRLAFAEYFNKTAWTLRTIPTPSGAKSTELTSVSCLSGGCHAAGAWYNKENNKVTLASNSSNAEFTTWSNVEPANQASPQNELLGISCRSNTSCNAVGAYFTAPGVGRHTLAEHWNGTKWELTTTEKGTETILYGVSCNGTCMAVGGSHEPLAEKEGVKTKTVQKGEGSLFRGVSCPAENNCVAVGDYAQSPIVGLVAELWNGTEWASQTISNEGAFSELRGVACPAVAYCFAVGYSEAAGEPKAVAAVHR